MCQCIGGGLSFAVVLCLLVCCFDSENACLYFRCVIKLSLSCQKKWVHSLRE